MNQSYRNMLRQRLASTAIGASTIRGMAVGGTIQPARQFLERIDLNRFSECEGRQLGFVVLLDALSDQYLVEVPQLRWGAVRKFLNIFLRDCLYNRWVCEDYDLTAIESFLEVPLDKHVVEKLVSEPDGELLPRWRGVSNLNASDSKVFQQHAQTVAVAKGVLRVDLDIEYWRSALIR